MSSQWDECVSDVTRCRLTPDNGQQIEFAVGVRRHEGLSRFRGVKRVLRGGNVDVTVRDDVSWES